MCLFFSILSVLRMGAGLDGWAGMAFGIERYTLGLDSPLGTVYLLMAYHITYHCSGLKEASR